MLIEIDLNKIIRTYLFKFSLMQKYIQKSGSQLYNRMNSDSRETGFKYLSRLSGC